jgi:hypothetical protein
MKWMLFFAILLGFHPLAASERPQVKATKIDGLPAWGNVFKDARWRQAGVTRLALQAPLNATFAAPPESTQVRVLWSPDFLWVRFDCHDRSIVTLPGSGAARGERDLNYYQADVVEVFLDPVGDGRMYMEFELSPNNGVFDAIYFCTTTPRHRANFLLQDEVLNRDLFIIKEWNLAGLRTAAQLWSGSNGPGWSAVAAFPAKEILQRLGQKQFAAGMKLRVNFIRFDYFSGSRGKFDFTNWAPVMEGCAHISPAGMGTIVLGP